MQKTEIWQYPVFFRRNRVFRIYQGGKLFHELMGDAPEDGNFPEEWIASSVRAINPGREDVLEGVSVTEDGVPFSQLLEQYPEQMLGGRKDLGVLVKFLDSAIRLPMQVHPTREFSRIHFHSNYGKAESWLVLATREDACIYFGFSREISREEFRAAVDRSEQHPEAMTEFVNRVPVQAGDVFLVPAGVIHAIGPGCLILEVQEPTDFTIQPEHWCGDYKLSTREMYLGLEPEQALDCFNFEWFGPQVPEAQRKLPRLRASGTGWKAETLIGPEDTPCFSMERLTVSGGSCPLENGAIYIVTEGEGVIAGANYSRAVGRGTYFYLPAKAEPCCARSNGQFCLVRCAGGN